MKITTVFYVYDMTSINRTYLGERDSFEEAEAFGRWHAARRGIRVKVERQTRSRRHQVVDDLAEISRDALGRLWTDLSPNGAQLV